VTVWVADWLRAFGVTLAVEAAVAVPALRRTEPRLARLMATVALANLATHPLVWFLFPGLAVGYLPRLIGSETFAVVVEAGTYAFVLERLGVRRATVVSLAANAASVAVGLVLRRAHLL
jgi:hypothetical protein